MQIKCSNLHTVELFELFNIYIIYINKSQSHDWPFAMANQNSTFLVTWLDVNTRALTVTVRNLCKHFTYQQAVQT